MNTKIEYVYEEKNPYKESQIEYLDKEIERLNNIINELSKENQELKEKTKLFHKNGVFSLEYDKETLRDMVLEYQEEIERLNNGLKDIKWYIEKGKTSFSDLYIPASDVVSILVIINRLLGSDIE